MAQCTIAAPPGVYDLRYAGKAASLQLPPERRTSLDRQYEQYDIY